MKKRKKKEEPAITEFNVGDIVDLYFHNELIAENVEVTKIIDYTGGLVRYLVSNYFVSSNNLKKNK